VPLLAGFSLGLSLIVAIGAQNLFVLRQGIRREHVLLVATLCAASDAVLIVVGVSGIGAATIAVPWLTGAVRWAGAAFLLGYGLLAARRALNLGPAQQTALGPHADAEVPDAAVTGGGTLVATRASTSTLSATLTCLALTWLNPHVYLDTVFLLGSLAAVHGARRWEFAAGAMLASVVWFFGLAFGARHLGRWFDSVRAWRVLDAIIAVVMITLAISLLR
jgi:L-lysine exporter family protein LysE/ArgO